MLFGFIWGFFEGTFFFMVPDIIITLVALFSTRQSVRQIGAVLLGSLIAGSVMFSLGNFDYPIAKTAVSRVPFVSEKMFEKTRRDFETHGVWALCKGPMSGIPYKIYAIQASTFCSFFPFLLVSIPARLERFVISWLLFAFLGYVLKNKINEYPRIAILGHGTYWTFIYYLYWTSI